MKYRDHGVLVPKHRVLFWVAQVKLEEKLEKKDEKSKDSDCVMIALIDAKKSENCSLTVQAPEGLNLSSAFIGPGSSDGIIGCKRSQEVLEVYLLNRYVNKEWHWHKVANLVIGPGNISTYQPITTFMKTEEEMYLCFLKDQRSIEAFSALVPYTDQWLPKVLYIDKSSQFSTVSIGPQRFNMEEADQIEGVDRDSHGKEKNTSKAKSQKKLKGRRHFIMRSEG